MVNYDVSNSFSRSFKSCPSGFSRTTPVTSALHRTGRLDHARALQSLVGSPAGRAVALAEGADRESNGLTEGFGLKVCGMAQGENRAKARFTRCLGESKGNTSKNGDLASS